MTYSRILGLAVLAIAMIVTPADAKSKKKPVAAPESTLLLDYKTGTYVPSAIMPPLPPKCAKGELLFRVERGIATAVCADAVRTDHETIVPAKPKKVRKGARWEYMQDVYGDNAVAQDSVKYQAYLNSMGDEGWELIEQHTQVRDGDLMVWHLFKRRADGAS